MFKESPARGAWLMLGLIAYGIGALLALTGIQLPLPWNYVVSDLLLCVAPFFIYLWLTRQTVAETIPHAPLTLANAGLIVLMSFAIQPVMMALSALSALLSPNNVAASMDTMRQAPLALVLFALAVMPAIGEELIFRGAILSNYRSVSVRKAALVNGVFFGVMHMDAQQFLYAFLLGFIFTYFVRYTRSIYASVLGHFIINATQISLSRMAQAASATANSTGVTVAPEPLALIAAMTIQAAIFLPVFIILFWSFLRYNRRRLIGIDLHAALPAPDSFEPTLSTEPQPKPPRVLTAGFWLVIVVYAGITLLPFLARLLSISG